ncbi:MULTISPECIES: hypothetical protein [unclassified Streptomyces]|uniref:hypothetical protein n=1 Tax=unclassified Streptomyces TaxID=2593676 RepID=UPI003789BC0F
MELQPDNTDTLVVSWHKDAMRDLWRYPYETAVLLRLALLQAKARTVDNYALALCLLPLEHITPEEACEAVDRLIARGFVKRLDDSYLSVNPLALDITERALLSAQFRMEWNSAKVGWPGPPPAQQMPLF